MGRGVGAASSKIARLLIGENWWSGSAIFKAVAAVAAEEGGRVVERRSLVKLP
jgi:hypothetical protein